MVTGPRVFQEVNDKENRHDGVLSKQRATNESSSLSDTEAKRLQNEVVKLRKLYSDLIFDNQSALQEQERLELELLGKEKELLLERDKYKRVIKLNTELSEKLKHESHYYASEVEKFRDHEKELRKELAISKAERMKIENQNKEKDEEIEYLNALLNQVYQDTKEDQLRSPADVGTSRNTSAPQSTNEELGEYVCDETDSEDDNNLETNELIDDESDENEETNISTSLAAQVPLGNELHNVIEEKEKLIMENRFEIKALKNEKNQLYDYINRLLKNRPHPEQNNTLKSKLVNRKILRVVSSSNAGLVISKRGQKNSARQKRVLSNYVDLKSYKPDKSPLNFSNVEKDHDDEMNNESRYLGFNEGSSIVGHQLFLKNIQTNRGRDLGLKPAKILTLHAKTIDQLIKESDLVTIQNVLYQLDVE